MKTLLVLLLQTWGTGELTWNAKQFMCAFGASQQACKSRGQGFVEEGFCGGKEAKKRSKKRKKEAKRKKKGGQLVIVRGGQVVINDFDLAEKKAYRNGITYIFKVLY